MSILRTLKGLITFQYDCFIFLLFRKKIIKSIVLLENIKWNVFLNDCKSYTFQKVCVSVANKMLFQQNVDWCMHVLYFFPFVYLYLDHVHIKQSPQSHIVFCSLYPKKITKTIIIADIWNIRFSGWTNEFHLIDQKMTQIINFFVEITDLTVLFLCCTTT